MLTKTATPHSLQKQPSAPEPLIFTLATEKSSGAVISEAAELPAKRLYRRPDLRQVDQQLEKLFTFETETNKIAEVNATTEFSMPIDNRRQRDFTLTIELRRTRSSLRGVVRLRLLPSNQQIELPFLQSDIEFPE